MLVDACQLKISDVADLITVALRAFLQFCCSTEIEFVSPCFGVWTILVESQFCASSV